MQMFMVGGAVRDELIGAKSKDIDFTVVLDRVEHNPIGGLNFNPFQTMVDKLTDQGFEIFLETPAFLTVRARFPKAGLPLDNRTIAWASAYNSGLTADFVLARKEFDYTDGRRPDRVVPGTLVDDLARRDFTMNAIAKDANGRLIDPFNGQDDIRGRVIRAVGDPRDRLNEDALRAVRALRFAVTKGFAIETNLHFAMQSNSVIDSIQKNISDERIREELSKMFRFDTHMSIRMLSEYPLLSHAMFAGNVSLDATMKQRSK